MSSFNVVQVIPALESGGVERGTIDVANYLAELKIHNSIISNGGSLENELNQEFIDHFKLPVHSKNPLVYFNLAKKIQEYIQIKKINLVHVRSRAPAWIVNMMNKKNYKSIATFHNIYSGDFFLKKMYNKSLAKMDYIISISDFVKDEIIKKYTINPKKISTIYRGVDTDYFIDQVSDKDLHNFLTKFNINKEKKILLYPARLTAWKGQIEFLTVARKIIKDNLIIYFVGDTKNTSFYNHLQKKISAMSLKNKCKILGNLTTKELKIMYFISDLIISTPEKPEGFGRIISEALSMKKMVLAFNFGGVKDQLNKLDSIYKAEPLNYHIIDQKINTILSLSKEEKNNLSQKGREHVVKFFSKNEMVYNYKNFYESKSI